MIFGRPTQGRLLTDILLHHWDITTIQFFLCQNEIHKINLDVVLFQNYDNSKDFGELILRFLIDSNHVLPDDILQSF